MSRSSWKPIIVDNNLINSKKKINKIFSRDLIITKDYIDLNVEIYNGVRFFELTITPKMVGQRFGEFAPSRIKPIHKVKKK
jgi:small subunit ribosomal protein S19